MSLRDGGERILCQGRFKRLKPKISASQHAQAGSAMAEKSRTPNQTEPAMPAVDSSVVNLISATYVAEMPAPEPPPAVPGFEVIGEIGRGGMAVVYQARDLLLGRVVALKVLQSIYRGNESALARRFVEEARITSQLQHPGIPPIYQIGTLPDERPFLAMKLREQSLVMTRQKLGAEHRLSMMAMINLANSYIHAGRHEEGLKLRQEVLRLQQARLGPDHPDTILSMGNLANSYSDCGRHKEALILRRETLRLLRGKLGADHPETLRAMHNLACSQFVIGEKTEAKELFEKTLSQMRIRHGAEHPDTLATSACFARILVTIEDSSQRDWQRAAELAHFVVQKRPQDAASWSTLALANYYKKSWQEVIAAAKKGISLRSGGGVKAEPADNVVDAFLLAIAHQHLDEPNEAQKWFKQAVEWLEADPALSQRTSLLRWREEAESLLNVR